MINIVDDNNNEASALKVVKKDNNDITEYIIMSYSEDENGKTIAEDVPLEKARTRGVETINWNPGSGKITITAMVGYSGSVKSS